jgi:hypothetical protein
MITDRNFRSKKNRSILGSERNAGGTMMKKLGFGCMRLPTLGANDKVDIPQFSRMVG